MIQKFFYHDFLKDSKS